MNRLVNKITKTIVSFIGVTVMGLSVASAGTVHADDGGASSDNTTITIADKTQIPGTKAPDFLYGRGLVTEHQSDPAYNGRFYATSENYVTGTPAFNIFESTNHGTSWSKVSQVNDQNKGVGNRYQPFLYELPEKIGDMPEGTLLCAGNAIPSDLSTTSLVLYKSTDHGKTWTYLSTIANGGEANTDTTSNGPVWEPFLKVIDHKLVYYYSDETDKPAHSQKLVHRTSLDGVNWDKTVDDVAFKDPKARPGMVTVAQMPNGKYIMTYEVVNSGEWRTNYKISNDGLNWDASNEGTKLAHGGSPYVTVLNDGTIVANTAGQSDLFVNKNNGEGDWQDVKMPMEDAYSRSLTALPNNQILVVSGGRLKAPTSTEDNTLTSMVYDLPAQYHRATVQLFGQPSTLAAGKTANFKVKMSDGSAADFDVTTDDNQDVSVTKQNDGSFQLKVNANYVGQRQVTVTAAKQGDSSFKANFTANIIGKAVTPTNTPVSGSSTTASSTSGSTTTTPVTSTSSSTSQPTTNNGDQTEPNVTTAKKFKSFKVYAKRAIWVYKDTNFKHVIKSYAKHSRTNAKMFTVTGKAYSKNGTLRYKTATGYITANSKYVAKLYYQTPPKKVKVIANKGIYEYAKKSFVKGNQVKHVKKGTVLKVKELVKNGSTNKFVLTNGHYITTNKTAVIAD